MTGNAIVLEERIRIPADVFELENFCRWAHSVDFPDCAKVSFLSGEIVIDMSPEHIETHTKVKTEFTRQLANFVIARDLGEVLADGAFYSHAEAGLATEPDVTFCRWESLRSGRVRYESAAGKAERGVEVHGSPDLIVEIVSAHSVRKDTQRLRKAYFTAGVREYWLVDARGDDIQFSILTAGPNGYGEAATGSDGYVASSVLQASFLITRDLNPVGGMRYSLQWRE